MGSQKPSEAKEFRACWVQDKLPPSNLKAYPTADECTYDIVGQDISLLHTR